MSQGCCVEDCNHSRSKTKCSLKRFPTDPQKCKLWEDIIKRGDWERTSWDRICECHFSDEQFEQNRADGLRKLRWDAIPTLFGSNLRIPAKGAEEREDKKDSDVPLEENEELEELEVEIDENSNSDEGSDVETYIITGDLGNTIQVIKEKESACATKSDDESPGSGKTKRKRIVIRVPSSVGECAEEDEGADVEIEEGAIYEEERTTEECTSAENTEEEVYNTEETVERNLDVESVPQEETITENAFEGGPVAEFVETEGESVPTEAEYVQTEAESVQTEAGSAQIEAESVPIEAESVQTEVCNPEEDIQVTDTAISEPQVSTDESVSTEGAKNNVQQPEQVHVDDTDLSQLKSDWKNPKLKARDVKISSSRVPYKKKRQFALEEQKMEMEETAESCQPASENLENLEVIETSKAQEEEVLPEETCNEVPQEDEGPPVESVSCQTEEESSEILEQDAVPAEETEPQEEGPRIAAADETIASIEEKLEKIFSNDGTNAEDEGEKESPAGEAVGNEEDVASCEALNPNQQEEQISSVVEEEVSTTQENNEVTPEESENQTESSRVEIERNEVDTSLTMEVTEEPDDSLNQGQEGDLPKTDTPAEKVQKTETVKAGGKKPEAKTPVKASPEKKREASPKSHSSSRKHRSSDDARRSSSSRRGQEKQSTPTKRTDNSPKKSEKNSRSNSHSSKEDKSPSKREEGKKTPDDDKKHKKVNPVKESSSKQPEKSSKTDAAIAKTKEQPKELRSSKRCLISSAPPKRRQVVVKTEVEEEEEEEEILETKEVETEKSKKAKITEEAPMQLKRRGRPPRGKGEERSSEKIPRSSEKIPRSSEKMPDETKSLRHSKRTPKPTEKYKDSQNGKSVEAEAPRKTQKRKMSSEDDEEEGVRRGRNSRLVKKKTRVASPPRKRQEAKSRRDEEDEEEESSSEAQSICRVCGTEQQILLSIFGPEGTQLRLQDKIHTHLPIRVRQQDKLPLGVCHSCVVTLSACDSLVDKCTQVDKKLRKMFHCPAEEEAEDARKKEKAKSAAETSQVAVKQVAQVAAKQVAKSKPEQQSRGKSPVKTVEVVRSEETAKRTPEVGEVPAQPQEETLEEVVQPPEDDRRMDAEANIPLEGGDEDDLAKQLAEAVQHDAILVKKEVMESEMMSPMKRFGNTYSTGRRTATRALEAVDTTPQDRNSVIVIPSAETLRAADTDVPPHSEEYILSMDEVPDDVASAAADDAPKTMVDSILDDWDEEDPERGSTSAGRVLTIKNNPDSEIVVTRLFNDEEELLAEGESGEIIIQIHTNEFSAEQREEPFWPAPDPCEETIIPDTEEQQNLTWKCGECGLRGKSVGNFLEHKKSHQVQEKKFYCSLCDQSFTSVEMLALHKKEKHFDDDDDDDDEEKEDDDDELSIHPKKEKSLAQLDIEEGGFNPGGNCRLYKCAQCDKMFGAAWSWKKHMEAHELDSSLADNRVHKCDICGRVFFDKASFEDHKLSHTEGERPFQCSICDAKFTTWNVFLTHVHTHKSSKTICKKCGREFGDVKTLREHAKSAHPPNADKKFACHLCDKVCRKKIALTEHLRKHTGETPFECNICHKRFSRLANYRAHAAIHENLRRFACEICGKRFNRQSIQQRHMKTHTRETIKTSHVCRVCGEAFNKVNELLEHRLNHTRDDVERAYWMDVKVRGDIHDFTCKVCEMRFTTVEAVLLHMPSHTDDERDIALKRKPKAYTCDICHRTLWSKRTFQSHKQWHDQKNFPCSQCDKKYATQTGLNYHMFLHTGERPFQCSFCDKCYKNKNDLRIHIRIHTGEYPYKCKFCPKAFRSPSSLIKHGDAHTEERPFKCSFCDQAFKRENTRANHERIHTNDKRFTCKYCNKGFIQKGACSKHERWHESKRGNVGGEQPMDIDMEDEESLDLPDHSESGDSMDSYSMTMLEEHDVKEVDVVGLAIAPQPAQVVAEPVDEADATAPSSDDKNVHITLL